MSTTEGPEALAQGPEAVAENPDASVEGPDVSAEGPETLSEPPITVTTVTMDPDGDLILRVGSPKVTDFRVCSTTLRRHSPVFKRMLYGPWAESKPPNDSESQWLVSLPEDDETAFQIILDIIHGNFDRVPITPCSLDLYNILGAADKCDMTKCLRPWAAGWRNEAVRRLNGIFKPLFVYVAWELGDEFSYVIALRDLALHACLVLERPAWPFLEYVTSRTLWFRKTKKSGGHAFLPLLQPFCYGPLDVPDVILEYRLKDIQELS